MSQRIHLDGLAPLALDFQVDQEGLGHILGPVGVLDVAVDAVGCGVIEQPEDHQLRPQVVS